MFKLGVGLGAGILLAGFAPPAQARPRKPAAPAELKSRVEHHAASNQIPAAIGHAIVTIESGYRPHIVHAGNYGLMQIRYGTARSMGYAGAPGGLLNAETNLQLGMKYFARGWRSSGGDLCRAIAHYRTGRPGARVDAASRAYCQKAQRIIASR